MANLYICDNDSTEAGFPEYIYQDVLGKDMFKNVWMDMRKDNQGWGKAVNLSLDNIKHIGGRSNFMKSDYVLISNNDVEYNEDWFEKSVELLEKYPQIGVLGLWKHNAHRVLEDKGDLLVKDNMPAVAWLFKTSRLKEQLPFPEHGPCATKGGNGEDTAVCIKAQQKGLWVCGPREDLAVHIDGY
jgi:GT2 family glycosyltransferase